MDKLKLQTPDLKEKNIDQIASLFPNVITETKDDKGQIKRAIDFDLLKQLLSDQIVEGDRERYRLDWPGKKASLIKANTPIRKTLRPCREESVNFDTTENLYIEGDNFEVLKILQESYLGKIKLIYIDPPYNTGKDFIYKDNFAQSREEFDQESGVQNEEGEKLFRNTESNGRFHSDWLSMMYERLIVARDLLKEDGVIFLSIGDDEIDNLRKICTEIFGENNYIETFIIRSNPRGNQAKKYTASEHEYIICYCKDVNHFKSLGFVKDESNFTKIEDNRYYREIGLRKRGAGSREQDAPNQFYTIYFNENTKEISTIEKNGFISIIPKLSDGSNGRWRWSKKSVEDNKEKLSIRLVKRGTSYEYDVFEKDFFNEDKITKIKSILYDKEVNYENATDETKELFNGSKYFDYPKPTYLIYRFISSISHDEFITLDFFSGSSTTAHAVMQLNAEDGGNRKFIMVQLPEMTDEDSEAYKAGYQTIAEIGKERIRRAGKKIVEELKEKNDGKLDIEGTMVNPDQLDIGFRVFKVDSTNMKDVYYHPYEIKQMTLEELQSNVKEDRSPEDLLTQVILDLGLELSLPIEKKQILGNSVFIVQTNALVACFDEDMSFDIVDHIAEIKPLKVVFRDSSFKDDKDRINVEERFKRLSPDTIITVI